MIKSPLYTHMHMRSQGRNEIHLTEVRFDRPVSYHVRSREMIYAPDNVEVESFG
jgi:hypothetical protein